MALILVILLSLWISAASAQPVAGAACSNISGLVTSVSYPCTIDAGSNRAVIVAITNEIGHTISNLTFAGAALTSVGSVTGATFNQMTMYRQVNPPTGTQNLVYDYTAEGYTTAHTAQFTNVHQTTPVDTAASNTGGAASGTTVTVTSATGDLVVDAMYQGYGPCVGLAPGAGQTVVFINNPETGTAAAMSTKPGAASVVMTWTCDIPDEWLALGVSLNPVSAAASGAVRRRW
jgi:hypothetical protein